MWRWLLVVTLTMRTASAQPLEYGPRISSLGGAGVALAERSSPRLNPAGLSYTNLVSAELGFSRAFGLPELDHTFAAAALPFHGTVLGIGVERFGFELFRLHTFHLGASTKIGNSGISIGLSSVVNHISIPGHPRITRAAATVGFIASPGTPLSIGASVHRLAQSGSRAGRLLTVGLSLYPAPQLTIVLDANKDASYPTSIRSGVELELIKRLSIRAGLSTHPDSLALGIGLVVGMLRLDVAGHHHSVLGWSRAVGLRIDR